MKNLSLKRSLATCGGLCTETCDKALNNQPFEVLAPLSLVVMPLIDLPLFHECYAS